MSDFNEFFVECFNQILRKEESVLSQADKNISVSEFHLIEKISQLKDNNTSKAIAKALGITLGSLSVSAKILEKKGYITKEKDNHDKRISRLYLTEKGIYINEIHRNFHINMIDSVLKELTEDEAEILLSSLIKIKKFFN